MDVFVKTLAELVALILQALRLAVVLPATLLVGLNFAFVAPLFKDTVVYRNLHLDKVDIPPVAILGVLILLVAYALSVFNNQIIRFFEGYTWLFTWPGNRLRQTNVRRVSFLRSRIKRLDQQQHEWTQAADQATTPSAERKAREKARQLEFEKNILGAELASFYPRHESWRILPTRLGNVIAAAEEYSGQLYGLDAVTFWPFLSPILSEVGYAPFVEQEKADFDFLLNMVVVVLSFGAEIVYLEILLSEINPVSIFLKVVLTLGVAYFFYLASIQGALSWGYTIRTAFVHYRHQLRRKLGLRQPRGFYEERTMWKEALRFYQEHDVTPGRHLFDYPSTDQYLV